MKATARTISSFSVTTAASAFWALGSTSGAIGVPFGANGDYPVANYDAH